MSIGRADCPIGTTEAAVLSCVSVIAAVTAQREEVLAYWLDLYYQVRRAYEIERHVEEDPKLINREDLYPVLREMMRDALKSTAREKAVEKMAGKKAAEEPETPPAPKVGGWAAKKAAIRDRLVKARAEGVTIAELEQTGCAFPREILGILEAAPIDMKSYRRVEAALDAVGK